MKTCTDRQNLMLEYLYDVLDDVERRDLQGHVDSCSGCATALRQAHAQQSQLAAAAKREFPEVRFIAPAESQPATLPFGRRIITRRKVASFSLAASVLIGAGVTFALLNPWGPGTGGELVGSVKDGKGKGHDFDPLVGHSPIMAEGAGVAKFGLRASITLAQKEFKLGDPRILVAYQIQNVSKEPIVVWRRNFWPNHQIIVVDEKGDPVPRTPLGEDYLKQFAPAGPREPSARAEIAGNNFDAAYGTQNLAMFFNFDKPGEYYVQIIYEEGHPDGWKGQLNSNIERFHIDP